MKKIASLLTVITLAAILPAQTLIQRFDFSRGSAPYSTTAWLDKSGWEVWGFGDTRHQTLDVEIGHQAWSRGPFSFSGYGVLWPDSNKLFALPWVNYSSPILGGALSVNLAAYVPLNGGPKILFSDSSALMWKHANRNGIGLSASYWNQEGSPGALRIGPQIELVYKTTSIKLFYQPIYMVGSGKGVARIEVTQRF